MHENEGREIRPGAPKSKDQGSPKTLSEAGGDYCGILSSIRTDQDLKTFVADLRQNKEQLLSFAQELKASIHSDPKSEELKDKATLGVYLEVALKQFVLDINPFSSKPADYPDEDSDKPLTEAERREMVAFWATRRVALKWLDDHPSSEAAKEVVGWNIYGFHDQHQRLLKEMWPEILPHLTSQSDKKSSPSTTTRVCLQTHHGPAPLLDLALSESRVRATLQTRPSHPCQRNIYSVWHYSLSMGHRHRESQLWLH